jgi:hypothetical protein
MIRMKQLRWFVLSMLLACRPWRNPQLKSQRNYPGIRPVR